MFFWGEATRRLGIRTPTLAPSSRLAVSEVGSNFPYGKGRFVRLWSFQKKIGGGSPTVEGAANDLQIGAEKRDPIDKPGKSR